MDNKLKHLINYILGNFTTKALAFLSIPILTRILSPKDYGLISLYESLVLLFIPIIGLNMSAGISRYYFELEKKDLNDNMENFTSNNIKFLLCYSTLISLFLYLNAFKLEKVLELDIDVIKLSILGGFFGVIFNITQKLLMSSKRSKDFNLIGVSKSLVIISLTIILSLIFSEKFYSKIFASLIFSIIFTIFIIFKNKKFFNKKDFKVSHVKYSLAYGIPLIPHTLSAFILGQFDRIAISNITGNVADTGLYSFAYNIGMIQQVVVMSIISTIRPYFYQYYERNEYFKIDIMVKKYSKLVYFSALGLILFSSEIIIIMANRDYYSVLDLVPIIVVGYICVFFYTIYFQYASYAKKTGTISINTFIAGILNIYLNYKYIPIYGYKAAAFTTVVSYLTLFVLHYCNSKYNLKAKIIPLKIFLKDFVGFIGLCLLAFYILNLENIRIAFILKVILITIVSYIYLVRGNEEWIKNGLLKKFVKKSGK